MEKTCDLLVLGGGGGGLTAAVRAKALNPALQVLILEKADFLGGGAIQAADYRVYGSQWQKDRCLDDKLEEDLEKVMDETYWKLDSKLVGNTFLATGRFFDWLCTFQPDVADHYEPGRYIFDMPDKGPVIPAYKTGFGGRGGAYTSKLLIAKARELGVEILMQTRATALHAAEGKVTGVTAEGPDGQLEISCRALVLATGSWINRQEVLEKVHPVYASIDPGPLSKGGHRSTAYTGDGIDLAEQAGAFVDYDSFCLRLMGPVVMAPGQIPGSMSNHPYSIQVNKNGKRWICEPSAVRLGLFDSGHILVNQPDGVSYAVFDANTIRAAAAEWKKNPPTGYGGFFGNPSFPEDVEQGIDDLIHGRMGGGMGGPGGPGGGPGGPGGPGMGGPSAENGAPGPGDGGGEAQVKGSEDVKAPHAGPPMAGGMGGMGIICAKTIEELAEKIGAPADTLAETIRHYNECCEKGFDDEYFKKPENLIPLTGPYFAVKGNLSTDGAFGGVLVDANMQAYAADKAGKVGGLYVVGDFASGRFVNDMGVKRQIINDLAWAFASGLIAAESAVAAL